MVGVTVLLLLLLTMILVGFSLAVAGRPATPAQSGINTGTRYFLVLLRLAIGWQFLVEGLDKLQSPTWSSEAYLRESTGGLAPTFRWLAGDGVRDRLLVVNNQFPPVLAADWQAYLDRFQKHYNLDPQQVTRVQGIFDQQTKPIAWLTLDKKSTLVPSNMPPALYLDLTIQDRLLLLGKLEERVHSLEAEDLPQYGSAVFAKYDAAKGDVRRFRSELKADLAKRTADFRKSLGDVLTDSQKAMEPPPANAARPATSWGLLEWSDAIVRYGLVAVGACLLLGLFTRTACVAGAMFLLLFFLAMPPLPGWPEPPRAEGHYLYINKNIIEMLALLALATTRSGRWAGIDGLLQFLRLGAWRQSAEGWAERADVRGEAPARPSEGTDGAQPGSHFS